MALMNLKAEASRNGITYEQLADCAGVKYRTVAGWITGTTRPDVGQAISIRCEFFPTLDYEYLFKFSEPT